MILAATIASAIVVVGWAALVAMLPRALERVPRINPAGRPAGAPLVSVVVPARNEEALLPRCLDSLAAQDFANLEVIVVDDHSTDGTRRVAEHLPGARIVTAGERPAGWAGKCWAAWEGARVARGEWLLFLDADAKMAPGCVRATVAAAESARADLLAAMPEAACTTAWEALVQPVMLFLLLWKFDPRRVNDPADPAAAAPGSFLLFRRAAYDALGGHAAVRGEVVEDLKLAERCKQAGQRLLLANATALVATARPIGLRALWHGWSRVAVDGAGRSPVLAAGGAGMVYFMFVSPYAALSLPMLGLAATHLILTRIARAQLRRAYGFDDRLAWLQPFGALFAMAVLWRAALAGLGVAARVRWGGRDYTA